MKKTLILSLAALALAGCTVQNVRNAPVVKVTDSALVIDGINFGHDSGEWANDFECDDPRFKGPGMTTTPLLAEDTKRDATDCAAAYRAGQLTLRPGVSGK